MRRGDLVTVCLQGDYGKPRPALIIQSDLFNLHPSITFLPITSHLLETPVLRITVEPLDENGLTKTSQIMIDKTTTLPADKIGRVIGRLDDATMISINRALILFLGLA